MTKKYSSKRKNTSKISLRSILGILSCILFFVLLITGRLGADSNPEIYSGKLGVGGDLYITPYGVEDVVFDSLIDTKYRLSARQYQITMREMKTVLKNKSVQGTEVKILLENATYGGNTKESDAFIKEMKDTPLQIKSDEHLGTNFNHAKTFVLDDKVIISTANSSYSGIRKNREYWFVTKDKEIVENLRRLFERDWAGDSIRGTYIDPSLLFCPIDCRRKLTSLVIGAEKSIWIQAQYLADDMLRDLLIEQQKKGVEVRVMVGENQNEEGVYGLSGVQQLYSPYLHAKNMLVDDEILLIGSMNFSTNAIENNREIGILTDDRGSIGKFKHQFAQDTKKSKLFEFNAID